MNGLVSAALLALVAAIAVDRFHGDAHAGDLLIAQPAAVAQLRAAAQAGQRGDCATAEQLARGVVSENEADAPAPFKVAAFNMLISCEDRGGDVDAAARDATLATALPGASDYAWRFRFWSEGSRGHDAAALDTIEAVAKSNPIALDELPPGEVWLLYRSLDRDTHSAAAVRLLRLMTSAYQPIDPAWALDDDRGSAAALLAGKLLRAGDRAGAQAALVGIDSVDAMSSVLADPLLRPLAGDRQDLRGAAEDDLARHSAAIARDPDLLRPVVETSRDLRRLGRSSEAVAVLEGARARITGGKPFRDGAEQLAWWWNELAYAHAATGDYDGMVAAFRNAIGLPERGAGNVSQVINLASEQVAFGRYGQALLTLQPFSNGVTANPYGMMQVRGVRGCALALSGRSGEARSDLKAAIEHQADDASVVMDLQLCLGDQDAAAASIISGLADERRQQSLLVRLARYDPPEPHAPADTRDERLQVVARRPDVQAALARIGGTMVIRLQRSTI